MSDDPVLEVARAKQRGALARAKARAALTRLNSGTGTPTEQHELEAIQRDTAMIRRLTAIWRRHPSKLGKHATIHLPSGKRYRFDRDAGKFDRDTP
jgi:hypothetical protein